MIYFILPVYNEEKNIANVISALRKNNTSGTYRIIAVNDGSRDSSLRILEQLAGDDLHIATHSFNMNIGCVFSTGIHAALAESANDNDIVVIMEADQTSSLDFLSALCAPILQGEKDIGIASRYCRGGGYRNFPFSRMVFSCIANKLLSFVFSVPGVRDYTIFFRAYRVGIIRQAVSRFGLFGLLQLKGFAANAELLLKLSLEKPRIYEIPFLYDYAKKKGKSKLRIFSTIGEYVELVRYFRGILKRWQYVSKGAKP